MRHSPLDLAMTGVAVDLLSEAFGQQMLVAAAEPLGHDWAAVSRIVLRNPVGAVSTAIVKTVRTDGGVHGGRPFLRREIAAHLLLRSVTEPGVAARLYGYDLDAGVMVVEDVAGVTVEECVLGDEPTVATGALCAHASALGRLHRQSVGRDEEYLEILLGLGADHSERAWSGLDPDERTLSQIEAAAETLGFAPPPPAHDEYATLCGRLRRENQVLAHVDSNPGNVLYDPSSGARLVDLESSAWTHASADVAQFLMPFPFWSAHLSSLPPIVRAEVIDAYRAAMPDNWDLDAVMAMALVGPIIRRLARIKAIADETVSAEAQWRRRSQMIHQLDVTESVGSALAPPLKRVLPALTTWLAHFRSAFAQRWPEALEPPIEPFPAFGGIRRPTS